MVVGSGTPVGETISLRAQQSYFYGSAATYCRAGGPPSLFRHSSLEALHRTDGGLHEGDHNTSSSSFLVAGFSPHFPTPLSMFVRSPFSFPWIRCRAAMYERLLVQGIMILAREPPGLLLGRRSSASFHKAVSTIHDCHCMDRARV
ncbi:hypothetical protein BDW42DRAFT_184898 [Aspergillus taichungensis]|uniref:Uncharacterized protein n=1 Tax=Aspergillus taichungensis TaxID=482145 RepID=A0A2J5HXU0_9EURO|nr:hypothetical protein BDW42DRAFT_184898 [Aspergillus taichungensis]